MSVTSSDEQLWRSWVGWRTMFFSVLCWFRI